MTMCPMASSANSWRKPDNVVATDNHTIDKSTYQAPDYGYACLKYAKATDNFDRSKEPPSGPNPVVKLPPLWRTELPNGIQAIGTVTREQPTVAIVISLPGGHLAQAGRRDQAGLAQLHARMLNEDTQNRTAEEMSLELQKLGSSIFASSALDHLSFSVQALTKNLDRTLPLIEERLLRPKFTAAALDRIKKQTFEGFKAAKGNPEMIATDVMAKLRYGSDHILGIDDDGTEESVSKITLHDIERHRR